METPVPMTDERLEEIRQHSAPMPVEVAVVRVHKEELLREVDRLKRTVADMESKLNTFSEVRDSIEKALREAAAEVNNIYADLRRNREAVARQRKLAEASRLAESTAAASDCEELVSDPQLAILESGGWPAPAAGHTVLWLFRAGRGPVYASRQKPEPQVLTGVLAWTVDGEICPVSLPLRDWIEPGQRMALVAAPIGGDA